MDNITLLSSLRRLYLKASTATTISNAVPEVSAAATNSKGFIGEVRISRVLIKPKMAPVKVCDESGEHLSLPWDDPSL